jgi:hypothetical protein
MRSRPGLALGSGGPTDRYHFALGYDTHRDRLVVHGGARGQGADVELYGDTWEWDGAAWTQVATEGPARDHHAMAYDAARRQLILFGGGHGEDPSFHGDTWLWDGKRWESIDSADSSAADADADSPAAATTDPVAERPGPPARASHRLSFDEARQRVVMHGGFGNDDTVLGDTWEWDGRVWLEVSPALAAAAASPGPLVFMRTAWDRKRGVTVLFGGSNPPFQHKGETWTWDGARWQQQEVAGPSPRSMHALASDPSRERVVLFGGMAAGGARADLWEWDGAAWSEVPAPAVER